MTARERDATVPLDAIDVFAVPPRTLLVRVRDRDGAEGWGEAGGDVWAPAVAEAIRAAAPLLVGRPAGRIEEARRLVALGGFWRGGPILGAASAGVEAALWDLLGRRLGVPVHALLGGAVRDRVPTYAWVDAEPHAATPEAAAEEAAGLVAAGFRVVKAVLTGPLDPLPDAGVIRDAVRRAEAIRAAVGPDVGLIVDFHGRAGPPAARRLIAALDPVGPLFIEEPVLPEHVARLPDVRGTSTTPLAAGERLHDRPAAARLLDAGIDVVQPDVALCGGLLELLRIATLADDRGALLAPHCALGPLALAASVQCSAVVPALLVQEQLWILEGRVAPPYLDMEALSLVDGAIALPTGPGLGLAVDGPAVERAAARGGWDARTPSWRRSDGSLTEW